jgi:hypothetical protein
MVHQNIIYNEAHFSIKFRKLTNTVMTCFQQVDYQLSRTIKFTIPKFKRHYQLSRTVKFTIPKFKRHLGINHSLTLPFTAKCTHCLGRLSATPISNIFNFWYIQSLFFMPAQIHMSFKTEIWLAGLVSGSERVKMEYTFSM